MIDNIWSGWRSEYLLDLPSKSPNRTAESGGGTPSVFRRILESGLTDEEAFIVHRGSNVVTIMNAYPYTVGHVLVLPFRQVAELIDLSDEESRELWVETEAAVRAIRAALNPDGINIGLNLGPAAGGSVNEHLHVHVVPRWFGDANFMVTTATTKSIAEALDVTCARLREAWVISENETIPVRKEET